MIDLKINNYYLVKCTFLEVIIKITKFKNGIYSYKVIKNICGNDTSIHFFNKGSAWEKYYIVKQLEPDEAFLEVI